VPRHSHQDALDEETYDRLRRAVTDVKDRFQRECEMIVVAGGRLGLRAGEICHLQPSWVNTERGLIEIPSHEPCDCGYCQKQATLAADHDDDLTYDEALEERWEPKTKHSVRAVPYDFDDEVAAVVEAFAATGGYDHSRVSVNRRVDRVAEAAGLNTDEVYPHALRATAATYHAYRGLPAPALQSLMGWSQLAVAEKYIRLSGEQTANALREVHGRN